MAQGSITERNARHAARIALLAAITTTAEKIKEEAEQSHLSPQGLEHLARAYEHVVTPPTGESGGAASA